MPLSSLARVSNGACYSHINTKKKRSRHDRDVICEFLAALRLRNTFKFKSDYDFDVWDDIEMCAAQFTRDPSFVSGYDSDGREKKNAHL